ncbi:hypothetical protein BDW74DRAFT_176588 [Aspergillus multicolor]|uniref:uncharacterized protein n=1 Tax=Aspergillus multicolor TaxID=41759 RepID=UPI003CCD0C7F
MALSTLTGRGSTLLDLPTELQLQIIDLVFNNICDLKNRCKFHTINIPEFGELAPLYLLEILRTRHLASYVHHLILNMQTEEEAPFHNRSPIWERDLPDGEVQRLRSAIHRAGFEGQEARGVLDMLLQIQPFSHYNGSKDGPFTIAAERRNYMGPCRGHHPTLRVSEHPAYPDYRPGRLNFPLNRVLNAIHEAPATSGFMSKVWALELLSPDALCCSAHRVYDQMEIIDRMEVVKNLPNLDLIAVKGACWSGYIPRFTSSTNVAKRIVIIESRSGSDVLADVIFSVAKLEEFSYSITNREPNPHSEYYPTNEYNPRTFFHFLLSARHTLKHLHLDCDDQLRDDPPYGGYVASRTTLEEYRDELMRTTGPYRRDRSKLRGIFMLEGCLADFTALEELVIGPCTLFLICSRRCGYPPSLLC